jgi:hypothetical protein
MPAAIGPPGLRPFSTHDITVEEGIAVKRFRSHADGDERRLYGDEPRREWRALKLLARYAPGLAPTPIRADLGTDPSRTVRVLAIDQTADTLRQRGGRVASRPQRWSSGPVSTGTFWSQARSKNCHLRTNRCQPAHSHSANSAPRPTG